LHTRSVPLADRRVNRFNRYYSDAESDDGGVEVGNVVGRWSPPGADGAPVAAESHLDSVPKGEIFDGPLGVYAALEAVRTMQDAGVELDRPIEVVSFTEEEGQRFSNGLPGSSVAAGKRTAEEALALDDEAGTTLAEVLESIGYRGTDSVDAAGWDAWLELHVEQDTRLERQGVPVGVVTTVTGITQCAAEVGEANHAGATPMTDRCLDALRRAGEREDIRTMDVHSQAVHDTMHVAGVTDAAMLFAPSRDGVSHNPREWTDWDDCAAATRILAGALAALAGA
jgi:N-carbamoyl-L-amino-acid hydrolase